MCPDIVWVNSYLGLSPRVAGGDGGGKWLGCSAIGGCGWGTWGSSSVVWDALSSSVDDSSFAPAISSRSAAIPIFSCLWAEMSKLGAGAPSHARLVSTLMSAATVTKKAVANIFSNPQHAKFLAAAASISSIPELHGVPEASLGQKYMCPHLSNYFVCRSS